MEYSNTTDNNGIIQRIEKKIGFDYGYITNDNDLKDEFANKINDALDDIWAIILRNGGGWYFDDKNHSDLPIASQNLQNGVNKYALPTDAVTIRKIEIKQEDDEWRVIKPITSKKLGDYQAEEEFRETDNTPLYYKVLGETIELFPAPDYAKTNGFKIYFDRGMTDFSASDTSKEPGFASPFHKLVADMAALEWRKENTPDDSATTFLREDVRAKKRELGDFYSDRFDDNKPPSMQVNSQVSQNI